MATETITLKLVAQDLASGNISKAVGSIDKLAQRGGIAGSVIQGVGVSFGMMLNPMMLATRGLGAVTGAIGDSIGAASDLEESQAKVGEVFASSASEIMDWADDSATAFGLSEQAALEATGTFGNFIQALGGSEEAATDMSTTLVELSADLASFNNQGIDEVLVALRSGLAGEAEPMRRLGADISAARVEAILLADGITKVNGKFTEADKVMGRYKAIMQDTSKAQGDFERTSDGLANSQRIAAAQMDDAMAQLGQALLPVMTSFTQFGADVIPIIVDGIGNLAGAFNDLNRWLSPATANAQDYEEALRIAAATVGENADALLAWDTAQRKANAERITSLKIADRTNDAYENQVQTLINLEGKTREAAEAEVDANWAIADALEETGKKRVVAAALQREANKRATEFANRTKRDVGLMDQRTQATDDVAEATRSLAGALRTTSIVDANVFDGLGAAFSPGKMLKDLGQELKEANAEVRDFLEDPSAFEGQMTGIQNKLQRLMNKLPKVLDLGTPAGNMMSTFIMKMGNKVTQQQTELNDEFEALGLEAKGTFLTKGAMSSPEFRSLFPASPVLRILAAGMAGDFMAAFQTRVNLHPITIPVNEPRIPTPRGPTSVARNIDGSIDHDGDPYTPLAAGGVVTRPTFALIGERGPEAVIPLDKAGAMGNFVYAPQYSTASPEEAQRFAASIGPEIARWMRSN